MIFRQAKCNAESTNYPVLREYPVAKRIDPDKDDEVTEFIMQFRAIVHESKDRGRDLLVSVRDVEKGFHDTHEVSHFLTEKGLIKHGTTRREG